MSIHMAGSGEEAVLDPAQAEQDECLANAIPAAAADGAKDRRDDMAALWHIHNLATAYTAGCYATGGHDIYANPEVVSARHWRAAMHVAAAFIRVKGTLTPEEARHEWAKNMIHDPMGAVWPNLFLVYEDLPLQDQMSEQAGVTAMQEYMAARQEALS